jgi:hydroxymethylpyrimidine kinase/phosphomethylpyrimidine kinase
MKYILIIAGSDSSGGAGIQADIKTVTCLGAHALTAITAVTAQSSQKITSVHGIPARFISRQVETILEDVTPDAVKIGMIYSIDAILEVADLIAGHRIEQVVVDPVFKASTGKELVEHGALPAMKERLLPLAKAVTPNLYEAGLLSGIDVKSIDDMREAAKIIKGMGPDVVVTGGHLKKNCVDILYDGNAFSAFEGKRIDSPNTHGTGCVFSSSLATFLAFGQRMELAVKMAHNFTRRAILEGYSCGKGGGPARAWPTTG